MRDLDGKGILRTSVETCNLALSADQKDVLHAECIRSFPSVNFPATQLLKREELETLKITGVSIIACMHKPCHWTQRIYVDPPFDLLYGFRGTTYNVNVLSAYEVLLHLANNRNQASLNNGHTPGVGYICLA